MKVALCVAIFALAIYGNNASKPKFPEEMQEIIDSVHNACVGSTGVSEQTIGDCSDGKFADDRKLKCYMFCLMEEASLVDDDGLVDYDMLINMIPDEWRDKVEAMINACRHLDVPGKDKCDRAFEVHKCMYKQNSEIYFLL